MDLLLYGRKPIRIKQQKEAPSNLTVHVLPPKFHSPDGYLFLFETISKHIEDKKAYLVTTMYCFLTP